MEGAALEGLYRFRGVKKGGGNGSRRPYDSIHYILQTQVSTIILLGKMHHQGGSSMNMATYQKE